MRGMRRFAATVLAVVAIAAPLRAHHSLPTYYDPNDPVTLKGRITKVEWMNPHVFIHVDAVAADGTATVWRVEVSAPRVLQERQLTREMLPIGTEVTINAVRAKNRLPQAAGRDLTFTDGTTRILIEERVLSYVTPLPWTAVWGTYIYTAAPPVIALIIGLGIMWRRRTKQSTREATR